MIIELLMGLIAGAVAGKLMKHEGQGCLVDIVLGLLGGWLGGHLLGDLLGAGTIANLITAIIGAVILIWLWDLIRKK